MSIHFKSNLEISNNLVIYSGDLVYFSNKSSTGIIEKNELPNIYLEFKEKNIPNKNEIESYIKNKIKNNPDGYPITEIIKYLWETDDGYFYDTKDIKHRFSFSGERYVKLSSWSNVFTETINETNLPNITVNFFIVHTKIFKFFVESKFLKLLIDYHPTWGIIQNKGAEDFLRAVANFFEKMYIETTGLFDLWDAEKINPKYFEYLALTLGHSEKYLKKIGVKLNTEKFEEFDILDKIKNNIASQEEINFFRRFLLFSSEFFRRKGSNKSIEKFLSFFNVKSKVVDLWTNDWFEKPIGKLEENFINFQFRNNNHGFTFNEENFLLSCNIKDGIIKKNFSSITLDNYHETQYLQIPDDVYNIVNNTSSPKHQWYEFLLNYPLETILDIRKLSGEILINFDDYYFEPSNYDIIFDSNQYKLQISPNVLNDDKAIIVQYDKPKSQILNHTIISNKIFKDFDCESRFIIKPHQYHFKHKDFPNQQKEIHFIFRGQKNVKKRNSYGINNYYKILINGKTGYVSLIKIIENENGSIFHQYLNISNDKNNPVYKKKLDRFIDETQCDETMDYLLDNKVYQINFSVVGNFISAYLQKNNVEEKILYNIHNNIGENYFGEKTCYPRITLFENISLEQLDSEIKTFDEQESNELVNIPYTPIKKEGFYGFGCKYSIVEWLNFDLNILDKNKKLYNTKEKQLYLKPQVADNFTKLLKCNGFKNNNVYYTEKNKDLFNFNISEYNVKTNQLINLYFNNLLINEKLGTRYTITFDEEWMKNTFKNSQDLINKIIVPFGSQYQEFVPDIPFINTNIYKNYKSTTEKNPGLFKYSSNIILDTYDLKPEDSFSYLERKNGSSTEFSLSQNLSLYLRNGGTFSFQGIFQEVCPLSYVFENQNEDYILNDKTIYKNPLFSPIVVNGENSKRFIGVRFKNCDDIERLIELNSIPSNKKVYLYCLFEMILPEEAVKYAPFIEENCKIPNTNNYRCKFFIPLGMLHKNVRTYSLNTNFIKIYKNSKIDEVKILGLFVKIPKDNIIFSEEKQTVRFINDKFINPYENKEKELYVRHYISGQIKLASPVKELYKHKFDNTYVIGDTIRNILLEIERNIKKYGPCAKNSSFNEKDYYWWMPKKIFRKRDFQRLEYDYENGIISNIPKLKKIEDNEEKPINYNFYGKYLTPQTINDWKDLVNPLSFKILDGNITPETLYYAKIKINLEYLGFNIKDIQEVDEKNNPISEKEYKNLSTINKNKKYFDYKENNLYTCLTLYIPISWYEITENKNTLEWFNYIEGSYSSNPETDPIITITPLGLMTYFINNSSKDNEIDKNIYDEIIIATRNWTYKEWNEFFDDHVDVEFIAEEISPKYYKIFEEYCILPDLFVNEGSYLNITYNATDAEKITYNQFSSYKIYIKHNEHKKFKLPLQFKYFDYWLKHVYFVSLHNVHIPRKYYDIISENTISFNKNYSELKYYNSAEILSTYFYNDKELSKKYISDKVHFNTPKEIKYIPYEGLIDDYVLYFNSRLANENLVLQSLDDTYNVVKYKNIFLLKPNTLNTQNVLDYKKSGSYSIDVNSYIDNEITITPHTQSNLLKFYAINKPSNIFDFETVFIFDEKIDKNTNYDGKKFEYILLGQQSFDPKRNKFILSSYFFVGIGTFNFDLALGYASYNFETGKMEKTFLAGFGDYNVKNIKTGIFYKLKVSVSDDYIRVFFNEDTEPYMLVINYFLKDYLNEFKFSNTDGKFEELVYIISGLKKNDIIYPVSLSEKVSEGILKEIFNEKLFTSIKKIGNINGFMFFNNDTYVKEINYWYKEGIKRTFGNCYDVFDYTQEINIIKKVLNNSLINISFIGKTINQTLVIQANDYVFYKINNGNLVLYDKNIKKVYIKDEFVILLYNTSEKNVKIVDKNFEKEYNLYVKDAYFNIDHIFNYISFTKRKIKNIWTTKNFLYVEFSKKCGAWDSNSWGNPYWDCFLI
ncbi:MAG: hypothetical protein NZZ41_01595 [Candidatus Dojkabacteria bacterium]|nr:hypothetical protein [Candidatus Dojkabacteria bacterium]